MNQTDWHNASNLNFTQIQYAYDDNGNVLTETNQQSEIIGYAYDELNRVSNETDVNAGKETLYTYDTAPNGLGKLAQIKTDKWQEDYEYDILGNTSKVTKAYLNENQEPQVEQYTYDYSGKVLEASKADGAKGIFDYQANGVLNSFSYQNGDETKILASNFRYNELGQITEQPIFNNTKVARAYDPLKLFRLKQQRTETPEFATAKQMIYEDDFSAAKSSFENILAQGWSDPAKLIEGKAEFNNQYWTVRKISNVGKQTDYEQFADIDLLSVYGSPIKLGMVGRVDATKFYAATIENNYAYIYRVEDKGWTPLAKTTSLTAQRYTSYKAKLKFSGNAIQFKVWKAAETEPANWTISYTDTSDKAIKEGYLGLAGYYARTRFDNLKVYNEKVTVVEEEITYQDDFSQSQSAWQKIYSDGTWQTAPTASNGVLSLSNNNIVVYSLSSYQDLGDYEQTLDIGIRSAYNSSRVEAEIAGRVNADKFYLVRTANGTSGIYKYVKDATGKWIPSLLNQASTFWIGRYTDYKARLKFTGNKIQYKIWLASQSEPANWSVQADDTSNPILSGKAGVASYNGSEVLDNLAIKYYQKKEVPPVLEPTGKTIEIQNLNYLYDNVGNITQIEDKTRQEKAVYGYDDLYRLTSTQVLNGVNSQIYKQDFQYDSIGNILYKSDVGNYLYENQSQPMAITKVAGSGYNYDLKGNLLNDGTRQYNWDTKNRLMQVNKGSDIIKYEYDNGGNRVLKDVNGQKTFYVSQDYRILPDGTIEKEFSVGLVMFLIKKNPTDGKEQIFTIYKDHLGSTSLMTDEQGKVVSNEVYYPYGDTREQTGDVKAARQFTGQINDVESGLYYYNARYYNANIGRFISVDPASLYRSSALLGVPQDFNYYAYARNNPILYNDPTGNFIDTAWDFGNVGYDVIKNFTGMMAQGYGELTNNEEIVSAGKMLQEEARNDVKYDMVALAIPGMVAGGTKAIRVADKIGKAVDKAADVGKVADKIGDAGKAANKVDDVAKVTKWKVGDSINAPTKNGYPSWNTVRQRYWKNEAAGNPKNWSAENLERTNKGKAPIDKDGNSYQIHHKNGRNIDDPHNINNLQPMTQNDHIRLHQNQ